MLRPESSLEETPTSDSMHVPVASGGAARHRMAKGTVAPPVASGATGMYEQPWLKKWSRRLVSIPGLVLATAIYGALLPILLVHGAVYDLLKGRRQLLVRFHLFVFAILAWHIVGVVVLTLRWLTAPPFLVSFATRQRQNLNVELWYIPKTIGIAQKIYNMRIVHEDIDEAFPGPILLLSRHASILDTIMPIMFLGQAHDMAMRIVQKHELLWDPVVDIASHRMPRAFVKRGTGNAAGQLVHMRHLVGGMGEKDAVVVFPEGSRFTKEKQKRVVKTLQKTNPEAARAAAKLKHVLPVRPAGTLAILDERPDLDVVFMAHTGLEGANKLSDFLRGALLDRTMRVKYWRVPAKDIPKDPADKTRWLQEQWKVVDAWIGNE